MWVWAAAITLLLLAGGIYETAMVRWHPSLTITELTKRRTHLMILIYFAVFSLFGYALGVGGR